MRNKVEYIFVPRGYSRKSTHSIGAEHGTCRKIGIEGERGDGYCNLNSTPKDTATGHFNILDPKSGTPFQPALKAWKIVDV